MGTVSVIVRSRLPSVSRRSLRRAALALEKAAMDIEGHAKTMAPVDTGYLKNSINANGRYLDWYVESPVEYSVYQEFGTRYMPAHPYLVPAVKLVWPSLQTALRQLV